MNHIAINVLESVFTEDKKERIFLDVIDAFGKAAAVG